jgi:hypothetical protein
MASKSGRIFFILPVKVSVVLGILRGVQTLACHFPVSAAAMAYCCYTQKAGEMSVMEKSRRCRVEQGSQPEFRLAAIGDVGCRRGFDDRIDPRCRRCQQM